MKHIESRPSKDSRSNYDFFVDLENDVEKEKLDALIADLKSTARTVTLHHQEAGEILLQLTWSFSAHLLFSLEN